MNSESKRFDKAPKGYLEKREVVLPQVEIPRVKIHKLSEKNGWGNFMESLMKFSPSISPKDELLTQEQVLDKARESGVFVDQFREYLKDLYRVDRPEGITLEEYIEKNNTWENSNIVEFSWKTKGRFVRILKEDEYFRCAFSRQEYIFSQDLQLSREKREKLRHAKIKIGGLGVGGVAGYLLVLSGAQNIDVIDPGVLPPHKFNRYIGADVSLVGQPYVVSWGRAVLNINPYLHLGLYDKKLGSEEGPETISMRKFMTGGDVIIEEVDDFFTKDLAGIVAEELGIHLIMGSDVEKTSVIDVKKPGVPRWRGLSEIVKNKIRKSPKDFIEATHLANEIIGREHIPGDVLTVAAESGQDFWPQDAGAAFLSAKAIRDVVIDILSGDEVWEKTIFKNKKIR